MFSAFLSRDMTYSCAIFPELDADLAEGVDENVNGAIGLTRVGGAVQKITKAFEGVGAGSGSGGEDPLEQAQLAKIR
jgi:cyclopropane-fatty-acyl-phospholipid synthase